jgi:hypothetical protein
MRTALAAIDQLRVVSSPTAMIRVEGGA